MHPEVGSADAVNQDQQGIAHRSSSTPAVLLSNVEANAEVIIRAKEEVVRLQ